MYSCYNNQSGGSYYDINDLDANNWTETTCRTSNGTTVVCDNNCSYCGDGVCSSEIGETCSTCPADCGTCPSPPSGGGGGGGGGGAAGGGAPENISLENITWVATFPLISEDFTEGISRELFARQRLSVIVDDETHYVGVSSLTENSATIVVESVLQSVAMLVGEEKKFDVTNDGYYDIYVKLNNITRITLSLFKASITARAIHEEIPVEQPEPECTLDSDCAEGSRCQDGKCILIEEEKPFISKTLLLYILIIFSVLVFLILVVFLVRLRLKKGEEEGKIAEEPLKEEKKEAVVMAGEKGKETEAKESKPAESAPASREEIIDYIKKNLAEGHSIDEIKKALIDFGFNKQDVEEAAYLVK